MPHCDETVTPLTSIIHLRGLAVPIGSLIVGVSLGGLVAAKLQELDRSDLHVICISSPTDADETELNTKMEHRVALYSSADPVIAGRTDRWPQLADAHDLRWLDHDTEKHKKALAQILSGYVERLDVTRELAEIQVSLR
jgi:esterase/lipase